MKLKFTVIFLIIIALNSCKKEDEMEQIRSDDLIYSKYVSKILPTDEGYWLITRSAQNQNCAYCSNLNLVEGLAYFENDSFNSKEKIGYLLDAETKNKSLITITHNEVLIFNHSLQQSVLKTAENDEVYKLIDKDNNGKCWILSNKCIFNLDGQKIKFINDNAFVDFEISADKSFWIASTDTIFHVNNSSVDKYCIQKITGDNTSGIYNLSIDKNNDVWINTTDKVFKFGDSSWKGVSAGNYISENFKTIPYMDVDESGKLWLAEKNYQSFTDLHSIDGTSWISVKLDPPIDNWINDIETAEPGYVWIATNLGLKKIALN